jgi:hypothetical protein
MILLVAVPAPFRGSRSRVVPSPSPGKISEIGPASKTPTCPASAVPDELVSARSKPIVLERGDEPSSQRRARRRDSENSRSRSSRSPGPQRSSILASCSLTWSRLTSGLGPGELLERRHIGFARQETESETVETTVSETALAAAGSFFPLEFLNRFDEILTYSAAGDGTQPRTAQSPPTLVASSIQRTSPLRSRLALRRPPRFENQRVSRVERCFVSAVADFCPRHHSAIHRGAVCCSGNFLR